MAQIQKIVPCLWFDDQAEAAANHYVAIFNNARILRITRYGEAGNEIHGKPAGSVMTVAFAIDGQTFTALNGGPQFPFTEAISLQVLCETQEEIDHYWNRLGAGGEEGPCGWLKDRYGLSWQVTPTILVDLLSDPDRDKAQRAMSATLQMGKIDIAVILKAAG